MKKINVLLVALVCIISSSVIGEQLTLAQIKELPGKKTGFYCNTLHPNVVDKIQTAPDNVIQYLCNMDNATTYRNHVLSQDEKELFLEYYTFLPDAFQRQISQKVLAIYFIDGLPFGGMADYAFDDKGDMYSVLFFNAKVLQVTLSEWLTERDNSPFKENHPNKCIVVNCSSEYKGLLHTLLHEACHIYDYHNHVTPYTEPNLKETGVAVTPFVSVWDDYYKPVAKFRNRKVKGVNYWGFGKQTSISNMIKLIDYLQSSPFSSIYGAKNWADDYAETFTFIYLKEKFNIEYELVYKEKGITKRSYTPTNNPLVMERYALIKIVGEILEESYGDNSCDRSNGHAKRP